MKSQPLLFANPSIMNNSLLCFSINAFNPDSSWSNAAPVCTHSPRHCGRYLMSRLVLAWKFIILLCGAKGVLFTPFE